MGRSVFAAAMLLVFCFTAGVTVAAPSYRLSLVEAQHGLVNENLLEESRITYEPRNLAVDLLAFSLSTSYLSCMPVVLKEDKRLLRRDVLLWLVILVLVAYSGFVTGKVVEQASNRGIYIDAVPATTFYQVESNGVYCWATRHDGKIMYGGLVNASGVDGTDAVRVINSALSGLTVGRNRQEKVTLRGRFECGDSLSIKIPSYTILDLSEAEIVDVRLPGDEGKGSEQIIENADAGGNTWIMIIGGRVDGQREDYTSSTGEGDGIRLVNCTHSAVRGTHVKSASRAGLMTISCQYCTFSDVTVEDCAGFGQIEQTGDSDCVWLRCVARDSSVSGCGFNWCTQATRLSFISCEAINNSAGEGFGSSNTIEGRIGFFECKAEFNGKNGYYLHYGETLYYCVARDNSQSSALVYDGITTDGTLGSSNEGVMIMGGASYDDQTNKTQRYGMSLINARSIAIGVDCRGNGDANYDIIWNIGITAKNSISMCKGRMRYQGYFSPQPSLPSSGVAYINVYCVQCMVFVSGGNVSDIAINGQATGLTSGSFLLDPQDSIALIYTSEPTWKWFAYGNMDL